METKRKGSDDTKVMTRWEKRENDRVCVITEQIHVE